MAMTTHQHVVLAVLQAPLTAAQVFSTSDYFEDRAAASRAIYEAKQAGYIEETGHTVVNHEGPGRRQVATYQPTFAGRALLAAGVTHEEPRMEDPVLDAIKAPPPAALPEAAMHAARLRALATYGAVQDPVREWLNQLADLIDAG